MVEFNKVYHTKTMLKLLVGQGHLNLAINLANAILVNQPDDAYVLKIRDDIKLEQRKNFTPKPTEVPVIAPQILNNLENPEDKKIVYLQNMLTALNERGKNCGT